MHLTFTLQQNSVEGLRLCYPIPLLTRLTLHSQSCMLCGGVQGQPCPQSSITVITVITRTWEICKCETIVFSATTQLHLQQQSLHPTMSHHLLRLILDWNKPKSKSKKCTCTPFPLYLYLVMSPLKMAAVWRRKLSNRRVLSKRCRNRGLARAELPDAPTSRRPPCPDAMQHRHLCPTGQILLLMKEKKRGDRKKDIIRWPKVRFLIMGRVRPCCFIYF